MILGSTPPKTMCSPPIAKKKCTRASRDTHPPSLDEGLSPSYPAVALGYSMSVLYFISASGSLLLFYFKSSYSSFNIYCSSLSYCKPPNSHLYTCSHMILESRNGKIQTQRSFERLTLTTIYY